MWSARNFGLFWILLQILEVTAIHSIHPITELFTFNWELCCNRFTQCYDRLKEFIPGMFRVCRTNVVPVQFYLFKYWDIRKYNYSLLNLMQAQLDLFCLENDFIDGNYELESFPGSIYKTIFMNIIWKLKFCSKGE